jgi:hypothetical protein
VHVGTPLLVHTEVLENLIPLSTYFKESELNAAHRERPERLDDVSMACGQNTDTCISIEHPHGMQLKERSRSRQFLETSKDSVGGFRVSAVAICAVLWQDECKRFKVPSLAQLAHEKFPRSLVVELLTFEATVTGREGKRHLLVHLCAASSIVRVPVPAIFTTVAGSEWHSDCNGLKVLPIARSDFAHPRVCNQVSVQTWKEGVSTSFPRRWCLAVLTREAELVVAIEDGICLLVDHSTSPQYSEVVFVLE